MRRSLWWAAAVAVVVALAAVPASAQNGKHPEYNVKAEVTVKGKAVEVTVKPDWMGDKSVNILLAGGDQKKVHVDVAPEDLVKLLDLVVTPGDDLEITGCWATWNGEQVLLARQIRKSNVVIAVRSPEGKPVW